MRKCQRRAFTGRRLANTSIPPQTRASTSTRKIACKALTVVRVDNGIHVGLSDALSLALAHERCRQATNSRSGCRKAFPDQLERVADCASVTCAQRAQCLS